MAYCYYYNYYYFTICCQILPNCNSINIETYSFINNCAIDSLTHCLFAGWLSKKKTKTNEKKYINKWVVEDTESAVEIKIEMVCSILAIILAIC